MLEMAIVASVLIALLLLVIDFGLALSFKQDLVRAAAEGARVGAVAPIGQSDTAALDALEDAVTSFTASDERCNGPSGYMECTARTVPCPENPALSCVEVAVTFHYSDSGRQIGPVGNLEKTMTASAIARTN